MEIEAFQTTYIYIYRYTFNWVHDHERTRLTCYIAMSFSTIWVLTELPISFIPNCQTCCHELVYSVLPHKSWKGPSAIADQFKNSNSVCICSDLPTHPSISNRNALGIFCPSTQGWHVHVFSIYSTAVWGFDEPIRPRFIHGRVFEQKRKVFFRTSRLGPISYKDMFWVKM